MAPSSHSIPPAPPTVCHAWARITRHQVFPGGLLAQARTLQHSKTHLFPYTGLASVIADFLGATRTFGDLTLPFAAVAMDVVSATPFVIDVGSLLPALLASAAIPGVFPPVDHDGRRLYDGGVVANVPLRQAVAMGARSLVVLDCTFPGHLLPPPESLAETLLFTAMVTMRSQTILEDPSSPPRSQSSTSPVRPPVGAHPSTSTSPSSSSKAPTKPLSPSSTTSGSTVPASTAPHRDSDANERRRREVPLSTTTWRRRPRRSPAVRQSDPPGNRGPENFDEGSAPDDGLLGHLVEYCAVRGQQVALRDIRKRPPGPTSLRRPHVSGRAAPRSCRTHPRRSGCRQSHSPRRPAPRPGGVRMPPTASPS